MGYWGGAQRLCELMDLSERHSFFLSFSVVTFCCSLCRNVEAFETILVNLITSQTFTEPLSVTEDDIALLARPVRITH